MSKKKIVGTDYDGNLHEIVQVTFCEHCGKVSKQYGASGDGATWCNSCAHANGIDIDELRKRATASPKST